MFTLVSLSGGASCRHLRGNELAIASLCSDLVHQLFLFLSMVVPLCACVFVAVDVLSENYDVIT